MCARARRVYQANRETRRARSPRAGGPQTSGMMATDAVCRSCAPPRPTVACIEAATLDAYAYAYPVVDLWGVRRQDTCSGSSDSGTPELLRRCSGDVQWDTRSSGAICCDLLPHEGTAVTRASFYIKGYRVAHEDATLGGCTFNIPDAAVSISQPCVLMRAGGGASDGVVNITLGVAGVPALRVAAGRTKSDNGEWSSFDRRRCARVVLLSVLRYGMVVLLIVGLIGTLLYLASRILLCFGERVESLAARSRQDEIVDLRAQRRGRGDAYERAASDNTAEGHAELIAAGGGAAAAGVLDSTLSALL